MTSSTGFVPAVHQCFPRSSKYDSPCARKPLSYAYTEQFTTLMVLCDYRLQGRPVKNLKDHIDRAFMNSEKPEMNLLITTANDPNKIIHFLATKFPVIDRNEISREVNRVYQDISKEVSPEALNTYMALRSSEVDVTSVVVKAYGTTSEWLFDPCSSY